MIYLDVGDVFLVLLLCFVGMTFFLAGIYATKFDYWRCKMTAKRVDANQAEIVDALRKAGATVQDLHEVGKGCPDILVGYYTYEYCDLTEVNILMEIKAPGGKLNKREQEWHNSWRGQVVVVHSIEEALEVLGVA